MIETVITFNPYRKARKKLISFEFVGPERFVFLNVIGATILALIAKIVKIDQLAKDQSNQKDQEQR